MRITREELIEGIVTPPDYRFPINRKIEIPDYRFPINRKIEIPDYRVAGGVRGEKETRYHSLSVLDKLKNKPGYAGKITPEIRGVPKDTSQEWIDSMAGAKTVTNQQYGNYGQQADYTPFMQLSRSTVTRPQQSSYANQAAMNMARPLMNTVNKLYPNTFR